MKKINNGQSVMIQINKGKHVTVHLLGGDVKNLYIHGGTIFQGEFRYVMHIARKPRKQFIHDDRAVHANISAGYFIVNPINIIL